MSGGYQILLITDDESKADLIQLQLDKIDIPVQLDIISKEHQLIDRLENNPPDLIISNYDLPTFPGSKALNIVRDNHPHTPFIFVFGPPGEEKAIDAIRREASDYVTKQNLDRLGPAVLREIATYKQHQKQSTQLKETNNRYKSLIQSVNGVAWEADADTFKFQYISSKIKELLGYTPKEWLSKPNFWQEHIHPADRKEAIEYCHHKSQQGEYHSFEYRMLDANDEVVWLRDYVTVVTKNGDPDRLHGLMVDITKEKEAKRQRDKAYTIADIGHWELDLINEELFWSDTIKKLHEVDDDFDPDLEEAIEFYKAGEHRQRITEAVEQTIEKNEPFDLELKIITAKNNERWIRAVGRPEFRDGRCVKIFGSTQDITEHKEIELKFRDVVEHSTNMFYRHDTNHVLSYISPQAVEFLGYPPEEAKIRWTEFATEHPINKEGLKYTQQAIETGKPQPTYSLQLQKANGEKIWVRVNEAPVVENGETKAIVGSLTDITEKKELELLLNQTNRLAKVGSWKVDFTQNSDREIYWSDMTRKILEVGDDYNPSLPSGFEFYESESKQRIQDAVEMAITEGIPFDEELLITTAKGNKRWIRCIGKSDFADGECVRLYGSFQDIHQRKKSELELARRNKFIETVLDNIPIGIAVNRLDDGQTILMNKKFSNIYGWPKKDLRDTQSFFQKVYPEKEYRQKIKRQISDDIASGDPDRMSWSGIEITTKKGEKRIVDAKNIPLEDQNQMISTVIDITAEKEAEREKIETLQRIGDAFFAIDEDWTVTYWNKRAEQVLGTSSDNIIGKNLWDVYDDAVELDFYTQYHKAVDKQVTVNFEEFYPGVEKWFEVSAYPSKTGLSVYFRDITERKENHEQLKRLNQELEERAKELAATNEELEQFAYVASHDLQEPLRMVSSFLDRLEQKYSNQLDDKAQQYINFAVDGAHRMRRIILDLLNYSRMDQNNFDREQVNVNNLIQEILKLEQTTIKENNANIVFDDLPVIEASKTPMQQVFQNLINNAIKYHKPGTKPIVKIESKEADNYWEFSVTDNGIGIRDEFQDTIFTIFQRLHTQNEYPGTGIGLSVSKKIIEKHGGEIWVKSEIGEGSSFYFTVRKLD